MLKQLGGIDASFLYMETPETPMHVAGLHIYELPAGFAGDFHSHFVAHFRSRVHLVPIFHKKLARTLFELDHPGWVDVPDVDLDWHIRKATLPKPGTWAQLEALVGTLHGERLDRARPLWQFTVIDGLEDGRVAVYTKIHHAAVDGGAGMIAAAAFYDLYPEPRKVAPPEPKAPPARKPTTAEKAILGLNDLLANVVRQQINLMQAVPQAMLTAANLISPPTVEAAKGDDDGGTGAKATVPTMVAPKTPFNVTIGASRSYAARTLSLNDVKAIRKATNTKVNDVVMAICAGALRKYLQEKKALPKQPLIAFVPISLREFGNTEINNQVFGMNVELATNIADPVERLLAIKTAANRSKTMAGGVKDIAPKDFTLLGAPILLPGLMSLFGKTRLADVVPMAVNLVISNTPGPPIPLYCAGAKIAALYPVSIPVHGIGLNMTVQSYQDNLDFGLTGDAKSVPDIDRLGDLLIVAAEELKKGAAKHAAARDKAKAEQPAP
jgi:WS/DGAT/MGAT family acyltransferase